MLLSYAASSLNDGLKLTVTTDWNLWCRLYQTTEAVNTIIWPVLQTPYFGRLDCFYTAIQLGRPALVSWCNKVTIKALYSGSGTYKTIILHRTHVYRVQRFLMITILRMYSRTSMARTLMARLPWLFRTRSWVPWINFHSCRPGKIINPHCFELPLSRTNFHGPKGVRAIEVRLYLRFWSNTTNCSLRLYYYTCVCVCVCGVCVCVCVCVCIYNKK